VLLHVVFGLPFTVFFQYAGRALTVGGRRFSEVTLTWWAATVCRIFGLERSVCGELAAGPLVVAANHISWIDIPLLHSLGAMGFVAKAEISGWPVVGWMARAGDTVFHERGSHDSASGVQAAMIERLQSGGRVAVFPEGGILPGAGIKRFHARLFGPAIETGAGVQPVMLRYSRAGATCEDITFRPDEHFLTNFLRLLAQPRCLAEIHLLAVQAAAGRQRRQLAADAESAVRAAYESEVPGG
jgi:1-acyl-sn-glycerol-3-phosphate acyltransferase